jgi:hypothetical protein
MVSVSTTAPSQTQEQRWLGPKDPSAPGWWWLTIVVLLSILTATVKLRRYRTPVVLGTCALAVALWAGCGGGGGGGPNPMTNPGTPAGTYTLTVTGSATSGSTTLSHNITLQFVVN